MRRTRPEPRPTLRSTDNASIAAAAERVAELLEVESGTGDRVRLWRRAAGAIRASVRPIAEIVAEQSVEGIHQLGIDYLVGGMVTDLVRTGKLPLLDKLEGRSACGNVFQRVPGIGPKLALELRQVLGVESLEGLARAAQDGTLSGICGFGPRRTRLLASLATAPKRECPDRPAAQLDLWSAQR
jgi:DNA polymerase/3'-5' exonuclease PolX